MTLANGRLPCIHVMCITSDDIFTIYMCITEGQDELLISCCTTSFPF